MLSVFAGSWDLEAAVSLGRTLDFDEFDVIDQISALVTKSMVIAEPGSDGSTWYRLLEPLRQYAEDELAAAQRTDVIRTAHLEFYSGWAQRWSEQLPVSGLAWKSSLLDRFPNLRAAVSWGLTTGNTERTAELISHLGMAQQAFLLFEIGDWAEQLLALPDIGLLPQGAVAAGTAAMTHWWRADIPEFVRLVEQSMAMPARDPRDVVTSGVEALLAVVSGDSHRASLIMDAVDRSNPVADMMVSYLKVAYEPEDGRDELDRLQLMLDTTQSRLVDAALCLGMARANWIERRYEEAASIARRGCVAAADVGATFFGHHCVFCLSDSLGAIGQIPASDAVTIAATLREQRDAGQELDQWLVLTGLDLLLYRLGHRDLAAAIRRSFRSTVWASMRSQFDPSALPGNEQLEQEANATASGADAGISELVDAVLDILDAVTDDDQPLPA